jgi:hypothetical protein
MLGKAGHRPSARAQHLVLRPDDGCAAYREGGAHALGGSGKGEDLPARFEASAAGDGFSTDEIANSASSPGSPSPGLNGWLSSSVGESPSAVAPTPKPLLKLLRRPGGGGCRCCRIGRRRAARRPAIAPRVPQSCGVVRTRGDGTGVPFVMALRMPGFFVHCGCRGLNVYVILARSRVFSSFSSTKTRLSIV